MRQFYFIFFFFTISFLPAFAQPEPRMIEFYDFDGNRDIFTDIFAQHDGGYAMCGWSQGGDQLNQYMFWFVATNSAGEERVNQIYPLAEEGAYSAELHTVIQCDDSGYLLGGFQPSRSRPIFTVIKTDNDGEVEWNRTYSLEDNDYGRCFAVLEAKAGGFLAVGNVGRGALSSFAVRIDANGDEIWQNTYDARVWKAVIESEGGFILAGGSDWGRYLTKINNDGEVIWNRLQNGGYDFNDDIISCPEGGFALCGFTGFQLMRVDDEGRETLYRSYGMDLGGYRGECYDLSLLPDGGFAIVGSQTQYGYGIILRTDSAGNLQWTRMDSSGMGDANYVHYRSSVVDEMGYLVVAGRAQFPREDDRYPDGLLVKFAPERSAPIILSYDPDWYKYDDQQGDSVVIYRLFTDTVNFVVEAIDLQEDELSFSWIVSEDTIATDSSVVIILDELAEDIDDLGELLEEHGGLPVKCVVSDGELADSVVWIVHYELWYLDSHSPDSLSWAVRRPREIDFSLNVRAIDGIEPNYRWIMTDREGRGIDVGNEAVMMYEFDLAGEYSLEGRAYHEDVERSVQWQIAVNSVLYWWTPHARHFETEVRRQIEFSVLPFNQESDSLEFLWLVNGEVEEEFEDGIYYSFDSIGDHLVRAIVHDGIEVDTVDWTITVNDPDFVNDGAKGMLPTEVTLYAAAPNPFNSNTSISYYLPSSAKVRFNVYDIAGRIVQTLEDGFISAGKHTTTLDGAELSAGIYFLQLESGTVIQSMKVVFLK